MISLAMLTRASLAAAEREKATASKIHIAAATLSEKLARFFFSIQDLSGRNILN
ncbi:MAG: hypothetical protein M0O96_05545 [Desulforhopalus sp.]|nr:hypothetical protein [Desulforhopalus sp.]